MNTNAVAVAFVSVLLCGFVGIGVSPQAGTAQPTAQPAAGDMGSDVSVFMQRGVAAANGSVDSGMWLAAFDTAENQSRKEVLVTQRAATLRVRLDRLETRIEEFAGESTQSTARQARHARLVADRDALSTAVGEAKTAAASEGVNASGLDRLSQHIEGLSVPAASNGTSGPVETTTDVAGSPMERTSAAQTTFYPSSTNFE